MILLCGFEPLEFGPFEYHIEEWREGWKEEQYPDRRSIYEVIIAYVKTDHRYQGAPDNTGATVVRCCNRICDHKESKEEYAAVSELLDNVVKRPALVDNISPNLQGDERTDKGKRGVEPVNLVYHHAAEYAHKEK